MVQCSVCLALIAFVSVSTLYCGLAANICQTPGCLEAANTFMKNMDPAVDPCQDFYKFACGGFLNKTKIPEDRHMWTVSSNLELNVLRRIEAEFNTTSNLKHKPRYFRLAQKFYQSCMDTDVIEDLDLGPMKDRLERLGGWPVLDDLGIWDEDEFDWVNMTVTLMEEGWSADMLVDLYLGHEAGNTSRHRLEISQPELGIPREYLMKGLTDSLVNTYFEMMVSVAVEFGAPLKFAMEELSDVLMFEIELAKIQVPKEQMRDHFRLNNPLAVFELEEHFPLINWTILIMSSLEKYVNITEEETVGVEVPSYFEQLGSLIKRVDKRVVANYILWHVVYESLPFLTARVAHLRKPLMTALTGAKKFRPRWEFCVNNLLERFEHVVGASYVRNYFPPHAKQKMEKMLQLFHQEFHELVSKVPWMSEDVRETALKKAASVFYHIAYPSELLDDNVLDKFYGKMNASSEDLMENVLSSQRFESWKVFKRLHSWVNKTRWDAHSEVTEVNAFYISDQNAVEIPAGILQDIFFSHDKPNYLNFGALGSVIAHELIHSVDDEGKQYDEKGNLYNWWDWSTFKEFDRRANEIVKEYSSYIVSEVNMTLNGVHIQGEVIADHGGIKMAYLAYRRWARSSPEEPRLPHLAQYTPHQMFWWSAAHSWCTKEREESLRLGITVDEHPPAEYRVNGPFRHSIGFAQDWACPTGSYMNPSEKFNIW